MKPKQVMEGYSNIDPKKIELIEKYTGGVIGTHKFGNNGEYTLENSFLTEDVSILVTLILLGGISKME